MKVGELIRTYHGGQFAYIVFVIALFVISAITTITYLRYLTLFLALIPSAYEGLLLLGQGKVSTDFFLIFATIIAVLGNEIPAITVVLIIMLIAHYIEHIIEVRTQDALQSLVKLIPTDVRIQKDSQERMIPIEDVQPGMFVIVKTGERIPVDGIISRGEALIQEAVLTGESVAQEKRAGQLAYAGTYLENGSIVLEVQKVGSNTFFGKISALLDEAGKSKAQVEQTTQRIATWFTPLFIIFCAIVWLISHNITTIITLLIFGSPLELALVTPLTLLAALVAAFKKGILIKRSRALESLSASNIIIFDKTGTLTMGSPEVIAIKPLATGYTKDGIAQLAAIAEKRSGHVIARAIVDYALQKGIAIPDPESYSSVTGHGVTMRYQGTQYSIGSRHFIEDQYGAHIAAGCIVSNESVSTFYLATEQYVLGEVCLVDTIRPEARNTIEMLQQRGFKDIILLSGDKPSVAQKVAQELGIVHAFGSVMPDEKLAMLSKLQQKGDIVTMVGDGINDAPALKKAHVGIALGGMGMEPAIEAADIVLMASNLSHIIFLVDLSRAAMRTIKQNLILGFGVTHGLGIILALFHVLTPIQAALFHAVPDFLILLNAARLIRFQ